MISSTCFGQTFAHLQERKTEVFLQHVKQFPSHRTRSATLPLSEPLPTTITGHYTTYCKKPQSCAPEDGQKFARNMLSWSLEINKTVIVASRWFLFYLTYSRAILLLPFWAFVTCSRMKVTCTFTFNSCHKDCSGKTWGLEIKWYTSASRLCW